MEGTVPLVSRHGRDQRPVRDDRRDGQRAVEGGVGGGVVRRKRRRGAKRRRRRRGTPLSFRHRALVGHGSRNRRRGGHGASRSGQDPFADPEDGIGGGGNATRWGQGDRGRKGVGRVEGGGQGLSQDGGEGSERGLVFEFVVEFRFRFRFDVVHRHRQRCQHPRSQKQTLPQHVLHHATRSLSIDRPRRGISRIVSGDLAKGGLARSVGGHQLDGLRNGQGMVALVGRLREWK
mmetsp:Transcript_3372/g.7479  ORF Transcript_3372/g.7479 Transcript_3372/m.7479 type:complete len:233 (-) Transcript_3372:631-1329(-)